MESTSVGKKIRQLRNALREGQASFGDRFGVEQATVSRWEKGEEVGRRYREAIAELAGMSVAEFFHSTSGPRLIPIVGYVSGGEKFSPIDDHPPGSGIDHITLDVGAEDQIAVRVRGSSMTPVYRDGDAVIGTVLKAQRMTHAIGCDCIIKTRSGDGYLKILQKGSRPSVFRLRSYNPAFDDIEDVAIEWAAPVTWVRRGS